MITAALILFVLSSTSAFLTMLVDRLRNGHPHPAIRTGRDSSGLQELEWYDLALTTADFSRR